MEVNVKKKINILTDKIILNELLNCDLDGYIGWDIGEIPIHPTLLNNKSDSLLEKKIA